jgi:hypothetical protein
MVRSFAGLEAQQEATPEIGSYADCAASHFKAQRALFESRGRTARVLLDQAFPSAEQQAILDQAADTCDVEELSEGMYCVKIDYKSYQGLRQAGGYGRDSQAVAVKAKGGISFIIIPVSGGPDFMQQHIAENGPHETHHVIWDFLCQDGLVTSLETEEHWQRAYSMFQDEIMANLSGNGSVQGYTHFATMKAAERKAYVEAHPEEAEAILDTAERINALLTEIERLRRQTVTPQQLLMGPVAASRSFEELDKALHAYLNELQKQPITNPEEPIVAATGTPAGWGDV